MTQCRLLLTLWLASMLLATPASANEQYNQGSEFAKGIKGQEQAAIGGFDPAGALPSYTSAPPESGYYGGVTNASTDLTSQGNAALNQSEVGKTITESILNTPAGNKPSMDAPFISVGTDAQDNAESVTDGSFDGCVEQEVTQTEYTNHVCSRDTQVDQYCERRASIQGDYSGSANKEYVIDSWQMTYSPTRVGSPYVESIMNITFPSPFEGEIIGLRAQILPCEWGNPCPFLYWGESLYLSGRQLWTSGAMSSIVNQPAGAELTSAYGVKVSKGETFNFAITANWVFMCDSCDELAAMYQGAAKKLPAIRLVFYIKNRSFNPYISWSESCPFDKSEGGLTKSECIEPGGNRTIYVDGQPYTMYSDCWAYKDTYLTQAQSEGSCREYMNNPACTIANRQCAYTLDGFCLHENLTYSCEHKTTGAGVMCGGTFFCKDGSCAQSAAGKNNAFQKAVSQLAAVAAAGKDVAELNGADVRAFTGKAQYCKKFAAGFSNCCKDSGWGQDVGLASCSSEEKALGEARQRKLTVDIGEFCRKKVLGVCVEKKRSYCVFESKLAQIVQQQGRQWQLGVGFGGASSPDCRGITMDELENIKFDNLDFSNFYEDLQNGSAVPEDNALIQRVQQQIKDQVNNQAGGAK
ncbi:type-F conjugative transfer system mating-pair stabilization protein TraN [Aeromonas salmonicida subsp. achromogenes]|uniref:type-F conjugative transfer system mating-pair stabilization protein TraN n=1 Tax=Aeromonas salmonicida TaxID=645 RepID=UPI000318DE1B|nr:type-F conjugative transfer system mating-pair stabilization protein TraN [Aeromonas salmonicida]TMX13963.1 type-F conjugative transfer system mating-pair stabilization protein TraN [Aeromonas salmonicida subsp. achromogenes]TMX17650.1 type-F conjugative transfer system mating-pair stabilization protein TraN [Aeromonas salmonicida subsp. achromogenes]TMX18279.1 type-F conjugative transfer system mating-pair stabilization protein TraN [Aeromonas salmonicida subsp. achromogenes]TMX21211.1 type